MKIGQKEMMHIWYPHNSYTPHEREIITKRAKNAFSYKIFEADKSRTYEKEYVLSYMIPKLALGVFVRDSKGLFEPETGELVRILQRAGGTTFELGNTKAAVFKILDSKVAEKDSIK